KMIQGTSESLGMTSDLITGDLDSAKGRANRAAERSILELKKKIEKLRAQPDAGFLRDFLRDDRIKGAEMRIRELREGIERRKMEMGGSKDHPPQSMNTTINNYIQGADPAQVAEEVEKRFIEVAFRQSPAQSQVT